MPSENIIKFTGSLSVGEPLKVDDRYRIGIDVEVYEGGKRSCQNGEFDYIFKTRVIGGEVLKNDGSILKGRDKKKRSQVLRNSIWFKWDHKEDFEDFYESEMNKIINEYINGTEK